MCSMINILCWAECRGYSSGVLTKGTNFTLCTVKTRLLVCHARVPSERMSGQEAILAAPMLKLFTSSRSSRKETQLEINHLVAVCGQQGSHLPFKIQQSHGGASEKLREKVLSNPSVCHWIISHHSWGLGGFVYWFFLWWVGFFVCLCKVSRSPGWL